MFTKTNTKKLFRRLKWNFFLLNNGGNWLKCNCKNFTVEFRQ